MVARDRSSYQMAGHIGGLIKSALCVDGKAATKPARDARFQKFIDQVPAEITDPAERIRRAEMLRRADMARLSMRAATARRRAAAERRRAAEAELALAEIESVPDVG
jgi:hypothetical protein